MNRSLTGPLTTVLYRYPRRMSLYTYLVDVENGPNGQGTVFSRAEDVGIVNQERQITTKGGITEIALGFASIWMTSSISAAVWVFPL